MRGGVKGGGGYLNHFFPPLFACAVCVKGREKEGVIVLSRGEGEKGGVVVERGVVGLGLGLGLTPVSLSGGSE